MQANNNTLRLKAVVAELEAGTIIRVLQLFQERNIAPRMITAQRLLLRHRTDELMHIEIELDAADATIDTLRLIAAKIAQMPITLSTVFGRDSAQPGHAGAQSLVMPVLGAEDQLAEHSRETQKLVK